MSRRPAVTIQDLIKDIMAQQRLTWDEIAKRRGIGTECVQAQVNRLGKSRNGRPVRHHEGALTSLSVALNQRGDFLRKELRKRGLGG